MAIVPKLWLLPIHAEEEQCRKFNLLSRPDPVIRIHTATSLCCKGEQCSIQCQEAVDRV